MALVNMKKMLKKANKEGYAVGQFNINNLEWAKTILLLAQEKNSPVILGVSEGAAKYMGGYNVVMGMVKGLIKDQNITVDVAVHLDHGTTFEACKAAIDAGFTSVMIDASKHPIDENIRLSKQVVDYAHPKDVTVEAEVGIVGGEEDGIVGKVQYAKLEDCVRIVKEAGVDCLAPALGSAHGPYKGVPKLGFDEMDAINKAAKVPLVLHGGSGIPDDQVAKAISLGVTKINVNTELQLEFAAAVRKYVEDGKDLEGKGYDPRKLLAPGTKAIEAKVVEMINKFGSANKA